MTALENESFTCRLHTWNSTLRFFFHLICWKIIFCKLVHLVASPIAVIDLALVYKIIQMHAWSFKNPNLKYGTGVAATPLQASRVTWEMRMEVVSRTSTFYFSIAKKIKLMFFFWEGRGIFLECDISWKVGGIQISYKVSL